MSNPHRRSLLNLGVNLGVFSAAVLGNRKVQPINSAADKRRSEAKLLEVKKSSQGVTFKFDREVMGSDHGSVSDASAQNSQEEIKLQKNNHFETSVKLLGNQVGPDVGKKTLVLDLDETLVHSIFGKESNPSWTFSLLFNKEYYLVSTEKRPYLDEFLEEVSQLYEIVFYTSSVEGYANNVIDYIDQNKIASGRLFRDACICRNEVYIKDLDRLGRDLSNVIVIDNSPSSYWNNVENAIPIKSWFNDQNDSELLDLIPILQSIAKVKDVRNVIRKIIHQMSSSYDPNIKLEDTEFQNDENIKISDRDKYIQVIGNYHPDIEAYNPARLSRNNIENNLTSASRSIRFSHEEINAFVFNHVHCQYSSNEPQDQVLFDTEGTKTNNSATHERRAFFQKVHEVDSEDSDASSYSNNDNSYSSFTGENKSNNTFAQNLYKNLENPSSVSDSFNSDNFADHLGKEDRKGRRNDDLKTFFCFDR